MNQSLITAINRLEDAIAEYFCDKPIPLEIQKAVTDLEVELIKSGGVSPDLTK